MSIENWAWPFRCSDCGRDYPNEGLPFRCPTCGGIFEFRDGVTYSVGNGPGLQRYTAGYPLPPGAAWLSLGEGDTPLIEEQHGSGRVYLKCEHLNPTGSFKDRGTAVLVSALKSVGVDEAVEDSSGNAGASFAAYAARLGIKARVFVPDHASGPKRAQIEAYGAEVVRILGPRAATTEAVLRAADEGAVYASHAHMPHILAGMATVAFEITEQLGRSPGSVILPVGQGTLLLGCYHGFKALMEAGATDRMPALVGVQARACAPIWDAYEGRSVQLDREQEEETVAEGIRIVRPLRGEAVLRAVEESAGTILAVEEDEIARGQNELASRGFLVEPTSAVIWAALERMRSELEEPVVAILTGSGFKTSPSSWPGGVQTEPQAQAMV